MKDKKQNLDSLENEEIADTSTETDMLNEDELKMLEASKPELDRSTLPAYDNSDLAQAKRYAKKHKFTVLFVILTVVLLIAIIALLAFMIIKSNEGKPSTNDFSITVGDAKPYTIPYGEATIDGVFYFDIRSIAKYAGLIVTGGTDNLKLWCTDGTYVRFENDSETATVNGVRVFVGGKSTITATKDGIEGKCMVPFSFVQKLFSHEVKKGYPGLKIIFSAEDNSVVMRKIYYQGTNTPLPISFSADCFDLAEDAQLNYYANRNPVSPYVCKKMTLLVNRSNPLGETYVPEGLLSLNELNCPVADATEKYMVLPNVAHSLCVMMTDLYEAIGKEETIVVTSAYRSYKTQNKLFGDYVADMLNAGFSYKDAEKLANATSAYPGESEHQSGLCIDLIEKNKQTLDESFERTKAFEWLSENAYKYGFILRYPKNKTEITGYDYEPWHYRFVGIDAATIIHEDKICLEEYLAQGSVKI